MNFISVEKLTFLFITGFILTLIIWLFKFRKSKHKFELQRHDENPLISPGANPWNSQGTFNPAAIIDNNGRVHMIYRAVGLDGISRLGYATSIDGLEFDGHLPYPVFVLQGSKKESVPVDKQNYNLQLYHSGGSWSGSEDPRMVIIDGRVYMTFNAFDGWDSVRVGLTSMSLEDFVNNRFAWTKPFMISPAGQVHKNWVLFPEKIDGKFAVLHSINPEIQIEYMNRLEELSTGERIIESRYGQNEPRQEWDSWVRSAGPPPLKTNKGWLVLYHAVSKDEPSKYKLGAMLLDLKNPRKIIARARAPLLDPIMWYENDWKPGIIYACGAIIKDGELYIYYGGGDRHVCSAHVPLVPFLKWIIKNGKSITAK